MKFAKRLLPLIAIALVAASAAPVRAATTWGMNSRFAFGVRRLAENENIERWPIDTGDLAYGVSFALYDGGGFLQVGVDYVPNPGAKTVPGETEYDDEIENSELDYVILPHLDLALTDSFVVASVGISGAYVKTEHDSYWTDLLYQLHLGLEVPVGRFSVGGGAYYLFDDWDCVKDFKAKNLEYGVHVGFRF